MKMQELGAVRRALEAGELDSVMARLRYGEPERARAKVRNVLDGFERSFGAGPDTPVALCSAPGRTEICGNHTDHQHGRVLAGAVDVDFLACAAKNGTSKIRFQSEGWPMVEVELDELIPKTAERESTAALVRGMAGLVKERGFDVSGFDVYAASEVLPGSGLSSSAACEVLLGVIENRLFCGDALDAVTIAQLGQRAENVYFGKPSGLMDQTASSVGGAVAIDFADPASPIVRSVKVDLEALGYALCIIDSGASHAALTGEYASIPEEMGAVAEFFGKKVLREVDEAALLRALPELRKSAGDGPCCAPCTSSRTTGAPPRKPMRSSAATWTPFSPSFASPGAPPGSCCRTSPRPEPRASRPWPWRSPWPGAPSAGEAPAASTAAASPAPFRPSCPSICSRASSVRSRPCSARAAARPSPSAPSAAPCSGPEPQSIQYAKTGRTSRYAPFFYSHVPPLTSSFYKCRILLLQM